MIVDNKYKLEVRSSAKIHKKYPGLLFNGELYTAGFLSDGRDYLIIYKHCNYYLYSFNLTKYLNLIDHITWKSSEVDSRDPRTVNIFIFYANQLLDKFSARSGTYLTDSSTSFPTEINTSTNINNTETC